MGAIELGAATALDLEGKRVELHTLWQERPAVIVWLRHYGCLFCKEQAADMWNRRADFDEAGVTLAFIGNGEARYAQNFSEEFVPGATVLSDPELHTYSVIGAKRGWLRTFGPQVLAGFFRASAHGYMVGRIRGHATQQGGALVINRNGTVAWRYVSKQAGDHPPIDDVLAAAAAGAGTRSKTKWDLGSEEMEREAQPGAS